MKNIILIFLLAGTVVFAEDPLTSAADGWISSGRMRSFKGTDLFNYINGGAELFLEFGFEELRVQYFQKGPDEISIDVYRMASPEAALGIYLMKCGKETPDSSISARNSANPYQLTIVKGNCFVLTGNFSGNAANIPAMIALTDKVLKAIPEAEPVQLLDALESNGLIPGSERIIRGPYALQPIFTFGDGDVLQLGGQVYGVVGDYEDDTGSNCSQMIIFYPDAERAQAAFKNLVTNLDSYLQVIGRGAGYLLFKDYRNKFGRVTLRESQMLIWLNLEKQPERPVNPAP